MQVSHQPTHHVHEDVSDHNHGSLMVIPGLIQCLQKVIIQRVKDIFPYLKIETDQIGSMEDNDE